MIEPATFNILRRFRAGVYDRVAARRDALFELLDAAPVVGLVPSLAHMSLSAVHRRRWGSLYDALAVGDMDTASLRELVGRYPLDDGQPIYALDTSVWPRDDAETSPGRASYHFSSRQSAGQPIVTGWSYAWLAQLNFTHDSWTAPLDVQCVPAGGNAHTVAAAQMWELVEHLPANGPVPLCVFDAGYDPESLARELAELDGQRVAVLVRLRSDRCFYADPPPAVGVKVGRPQRHGQKFTCADERTWWGPRVSMVSSKRTMARYGSAPGLACTPRRTIIQPKEVTVRNLPYGGLWYWSKSNACHGRRAFHRASDGRSRSPAPPRRASRYSDLDAPKEPY